MIVESGNPVHSLPDSQRMREAIAALEFVLVIDVAMTETARLRRLRAPGGVVSSRSGRQRSSRSSSPRTSSTCGGRCSIRSRERCPSRRSTGGSSARSAATPTTISCHSTPPPPEAATAYADDVPGDAGRATTPRQACGAGAVRDARARRSVRATRVRRRSGGSRRRASSTSPSPFVAPGSRPATTSSTPSSRAAASGSRSTSTTTTWDRLAYDDGRIHLAQPELLAELGELHVDGPERDDAFPFVLSAGERRSSTANTILRDPDLDEGGPGRRAAHEPARRGAAGCGRRCRRGGRDQAGPGNRDRRAHRHLAGGPSVVTQRSWAVVSRRCR